MTRELAGWDVDSPVQAEVFVLWLDGDRIQLTGPDGPQAWHLQLGPTEHPVEVVDRIVRDVVGFKFHRGVLALRRAAQRGRCNQSIAVRVTDARAEPAVFGLRRPTILWPAGLAHRLSDDELEAVFAHELCHVARRDNLLALAHFAVEIIFRLYPVVWLLSGRLVHERERACSNGSQKDNRILQPNRRHDDRRGCDRARRALPGGRRVVRRRSDEIYVVAGDGLFVHASNRWLQLRVPVASCDVRGLPPLGPSCTLVHGKIPSALWHVIVRLLRQAHVGGCELLLGVRFAAVGGYELVLPEQSVAPLAVEYTTEEGLVLEIHSHRGGAARFSETDDADEQRLRDLASAHLRDLREADDLAFAHVLLVGFAYAVPVEAVVLEELRVFGRDDGAFEVRRDARVRHPHIL